MKRRAIFFVILLLLFGTLSGLWGVQAQETLVRVGFYPMNGFHEYNAEDEPSGYDVEYLNQISRFSGLRFRYIGVNSFTEALKMLEGGELDMLGGVPESSALRTHFAYAPYSSGSSYLSLLVKADNEAMQYEDYEALRGKKAGYLSEEHLAELQTFIQGPEQLPDMKLYRDLTQMRQALWSGEIDMMLCPLMVMSDQEKLILKMTPYNFYYITNKSRLALQKDLGEALLRLKIDRPDFENDLNRKFYGFQVQTPFSKSEQDYVKNAPVFRVGCVPNRDPISYLNETTGEADGMSRVILDMVAENSGFRFEYVMLPSTNVTYDVLRQMNIDLISGVEYTDVNRKIQSIRLSVPYLYGQKVVVCRQGEGFSMDRVMSVATVSGSQTLPQTLKEAYPNLELVYYATIEECFEALRKEKVDLLLQNQYAVEHFLAMPRYDGMAIVPDVTLAESLCLSPMIYKGRDGEVDPLLGDPRLLSVIDKAIAKMDVETVRQCVIQFTTARPHRVSLKDFADKYRNALAVIAVLAALGGTAGGYALWMRRRNVEIIRENERMLSHITDSISGGVVMLLPNTKFTIIYVNNGFLQLVGMSRKEYEQAEDKDGVAYIHQDDIPRLNEAVLNCTEGERNIALELRVHRKDGNYVPALLRGTATKNDAGETILYCVMMDITYQKRMIEALEIEKERYQLVVENSNDILFDVDLETRNVILSKKYYEKFGGDVFDAAKFDVGENAHPDDYAQWENLTRQAQAGITPISRQIRLKKSDGTFLWCELQLSTIFRNGHPVRYVGRIIDIDSIMREREQLKNESLLDPLTKLYNKTAFFLLAGGFLEDAKEDARCAVLFLDLDNFKSVNDKLGHMRGDQLLRETAARLRNAFREEDVISRFGGDEFCILLKDISKENAVRKGNQLCRLLECPVKGENGESVMVSASIGVALCPECGKSLDMLMEKADKALYAAKQCGKNRCMHYQEDTAGYTASDELPIQDPG